MDQYVAPTSQLVVEIFVRDIARSAEFYRRFGFTVVEDKGSFISLTWEGHLLFLDERREIAPPAEHPPANVRIMVPDVERLWRFAVELGAPVFSPIADRDYGIRDFTLLDPDGFGLRFASRLPGHEEA